MVTCIILSFLLTLGTSIGAFYKLTKKTKSIIIKKKYIKKHEIIEYMIIDEDNITYKMSSLPWNKENASNVWTKMIDNKKYKINYYGINMPKLNYYYLITGVEKLI